MVNVCWLATKTGRGKPEIFELRDFNETARLIRNKLKEFEEEEHEEYCNIWVVPDEPWPEVPDENF